eukprot:1191120-Prorocentrum_minimum.AAC.2
MYTESTTLASMCFQLYACSRCFKERALLCWLGASGLSPLILVITCVILDGDEVVDLAASPYAQSPSQRTESAQ